MDNKKNYLDNELIAKFLVDYKTATGKEYDQTRTLGNNGYQLGQSFTLTGEINYKTNEINGSKTVYWYLTTEEGTDLSLMSLMGVSSLKGYSVDSNEEFPVEFYNGKTKDKETRMVRAEVVNDFDFDNVWQPASRHFLTLIGMIIEGDLELKGKTATFLGTAVRPFTAKKDSTQNGEKVKEGYQRVMETRLWNVE
jgi:hypothetical protein